MPRRYTLPLAVLGLLSLWPAWACSQPGQLLAGRSLGTYYRVTLGAEPLPDEVARLRGCIEGTLAGVDELMSTWRDDSEIARLNASASTAWTEVSPATRIVVDQALRVSVESGGAFDPTVSPLLRLWGFGPGATPLERLPGPEAIRETRERVGYKLLQLRFAPPGIRKLRRDVAIELSAIAKGYAVDALASYLYRQGLRDYLVDVGGEMRALGRRPGGGPWRVGIARPELASGAVARVLTLQRGAVASSGSYRRFNTVQGQVLPDTIDPRSGIPVTHHVRGVSVVSTLAMRADAMATALMVLGPREGMSLARARGIAALFIEESEQGWVEHLSPAFAALAGAGVRMPVPDDTHVLPLLRQVGCAGFREPPRGP